MKAALHLCHQLLKQPEVAALTTYRFAGSFSERIRRLDAYSRINWWRSAVGTVLLDGPAILRNTLMERIVCPGAELDALIADEQRLEEWMKQNVTGFFHPVGTCRMGTVGDKAAVVDSTGKVQGAAGLRVARRLHHAHYRTGHYQPYRHHDGREDRPVNSGWGLIFTLPTQGVAGSCRLPEPEAPSKAYAADSRRHLVLPRHTGGEA